MSNESNNNSNLHNHLASLAAKARHNPDCEVLEQRLAEARLNRSEELGLIVSPEDAEVLSSYTWSPITGGYAHTRINDKCVQLQRLVHSRMTGRSLDSYSRTDHVRHVERNNVLDCRRENLHTETGAKANQRETNRGLNSNNTSGVSGVVKHACGKWHLRLQVTGPNEKKIISLGLYSDLDEATFVRDALVELRASLPQDITAAEANTSLRAKRDELRAAWAELDASFAITLFDGMEAA